MPEARHKRGPGETGRWKGWYRKPDPAPVVVRKAATRPAVKTATVPMTDAQANYLKKLCEQTGETFDPSLSLKRAKAEIQRLKRKRAAQRRERR